MASLEESFAHPVQSATVKLAADEDNWELRWSLHGPDRRYNSTRLTILPPDHKYYSITSSYDYICLDKFEAACVSAKAKLDILTKDDDLSSSDLQLPIAERIVVCLNNPFGTGAYFHYHRLFTNGQEYESLMAALAKSRERGPLLIEKCRLLSA
jgi:hypothetical protein